MYACTWDIDEQERFALAFVESPLSDQEDDPVVAPLQSSFPGRHSHHWHCLGPEPSVWRVSKALVTLPTKVSGHGKRGQSGSENVLPALTIGSCALA